MGKHHVQTRHLGSIGVFAFGLASMVPFPVFRACAQWTWAGRRRRDFSIQFAVALSQGRTKRIPRLYFLRIFWTFSRSTRDPAGIKRQIAATAWALFSQYLSRCPFSWNSWWPVGHRFVPWPVLPTRNGALRESRRNMTDSIPPRLLSAKGDNGLRLPWVHVCNNDKGFALENLSWWVP